MWIDTCGPHGVWLDRGEFERFQDFVTAGGLSLPPPPQPTRPPERFANERRHSTAAIVAMMLFDLMTFRR